MSLGRETVPGFFVPGRGDSEAAGLVRGPVVGDGLEFGADREVAGSSSRPDWGRGGAFFGKMGRHHRRWGIGHSRNLRSAWMARWSVAIRGGILKVVPENFTAFFGSEYRVLGPTDRSQRGDCHA